MVKIVERLISYALPRQYIYIASMLRFTSTDSGQMILVPKIDQQMQNSMKDAEKTKRYTS